MVAKKKLQKTLANPKKAAAAKSSGKSGKKAGSDRAAWRSHWWRHHHIWD
ncbi:MAG: hypothetical protein GDA56_13435 [Hormoscilla sp. GM7CHS1pb]|nr:hypothetical protein [Hormoscilla sp. GM7CHS1pb]